MAFLWDLFQQTQLRKHRNRTESAEQRLEQLEEEVEQLSALIHELIGRLESRLGTDLDDPGKAG